MSELMLVPSSAVQAHEHASVQPTLFGWDGPEQMFRKPAEVVHSIPNAAPTTVQARLINALLFRATTSRPDDDGWYRVPLTAIRTDIGYESRNYAHLYDAALELPTFLYEWDVLAPRGGGSAPRYKVSVLFPEVEVHGWGIAFQVSKQFVDALNDPAMYARVDQSKIRMLNRNASIVLYELIARYRKMGETPLVQWTKLRDMFMGNSAVADGVDLIATYSVAPLVPAAGATLTPSVASSGGTEYKRFKARVLKPAMTEVQGLGEVRLELVETTSVGRRVDSVRFRIHETKPRSDAPRAPTTQDELTLVGKLLQMGLPQSDAMRLITRHGTEDTQKAMDYTQKRMGVSNSGPIARPGAYLRRCLTERWFEDGRTTVHKTRNRKMTEEEALLQRFLAHRRQSAEAAFSELPLSEQTKLFEVFNAEQAVPKLRIVNGRSTKAALTAFISWYISQHYSEPTTADLLAFATKLVSSPVE